MFREESCIDNMHTIMKLFTVIALFLVNGYKARAVTFFKGKTVTLKFIYPCDSTKVTLQQSNKLPFYSSTDDSSLSLPENQIQRFRVQNMTENESCFLNLTITDLMTDDQGTYILFIYKDGENPYIERIFLEVIHPPDKALCVVGDDRGGDWVAVECTANAGPTPGKIECFQNGVWMPPINDRTVEGFLLKQTVLIRKSQPTFCCYSALDVNISRCECDDTVLFQEESSKKRPCPTITTQTISTDYVHRSTDVVAIATPTTHRLSTSTNAMKMTTDYKALIIFSTFLIIVVAILVLILYFCYKHYQRNDVLRELSKKIDSPNAEECME